MGILGIFKRDGGRGKAGNLGDYFKILNKKKGAKIPWKKGFLWIFKRNDRRGKAENPGDYFKNIFL